MPAESILVFSSILFLVVFQVIKMMENCRLSVLALKYSTSKPIFSRMGGFGSLYVLSLALLWTNYSVLFIGIYMEFTTHDGTDMLIGFEAIPLIFLVMITIMLFIHLPTMAVQEYQFFNKNSRKEPGLLDTGINTNVSEFDSQNIHLLSVLIMSAQPPILFAILSLMGNFLLKELTMTFMTGAVFLIVIYKLVDLYLLRLQYEILTEPRF